MLFRRENSGASLYFGRTSQGRSVCGLASSPGGHESEFSIFTVAHEENGTERGPLRQKATRQRGRMSLRSLVPSLGGESRR